MLLRNLLTLCILTGISLLSLSACTSSNDSISANYAAANLAQGKQNFLAKNYQLAFSQLLPFAVRGNMDAQYAIGYMYYYGKGVEQNHEIAESWMQRAAAQGQPLAIKSLAIISTTGRK